MLPHTHALLGLIFSLFLYLFLPGITLQMTIIIFLASILIDIDHYLPYAIEKKDWSLKKAYRAFKNLPRNHKPIMNPLHTIEIMFIIFLLGLFLPFFLFLFLGFAFHSILDIFDMAYHQHLGRGHSLINYFFKRNSGKYHIFH